MKKTSLLAALLLTTAAHGQSVRQSGNVTPGHAASWTTNGVVQDAGTAASGKLTSLGVTAIGPGYCQNTGPITAPFYQMCLGVTSGGAGSLSIAGFGGATNATMQFVINGNSYSFPFTVGGITGPATSVVGHVAAWNNTTGSLLQDPTSITLPDGSVWNTSGLTPTHQLPIAWTQAGTGAISQSVYASVGEFVKSTQFGFVCDGATDNTTAFTNAVNEAIATTGELHIIRDTVNGYQCRWNSQIVISAPDGPHNKIKITVDPSVQMIFNGAVGGLQFNGQALDGTTGGRLIPWVEGGYWYPYAAGGGWAIEMFAAWSGRVTNLIYNQQGTTANRANVILMDNVFGGKIDGLAVYGCAQAVLLRNATNGVDVTNGDIENCSTEGIVSADNVLTAVTNAGTPTNSNVLHFAATPNALVGQIVTDTTNPTYIPAGTTVTAAVGGSITMSANPTTPVVSGDTIHFANSPSATNKITNMYLEQISNSIDVSEPGDSNWQVDNVFINQGGFLGGSSWDTHFVGTGHQVTNVWETNSVSTTVNHNDSIGSQFTNINGTTDSGIGDAFFRNHTASQLTYFCGSYIGAITTFYVDASSSQNNVVCGGALNNGVAAGMNIYSPPRSIVANTILAATDSSIICSGSGTIALTLPAASALAGKIIRVRTVTNQAVNSASSNVVPLAGGSASTGILTNTAGKWADLQSDGTNWTIMASN